MKWYVVMWNEGGKSLHAKCRGKYGFTRNLLEAETYPTREAAWKACRTSGSNRAVPECEEVVVRYLTQKEFTG